MSETKNKQNKEKLRSGITRGVIENSVDRESRVITGFSVISVGEAKGHELEIDQKTLEQVVELGNSASFGIKSRFGHPNMSHSAFGTFLGRVKNFRLEEDARVRADLYIDETAMSPPPNGGGTPLGEYTMSLAESDPAAFGSSIVFELDREFRVEEDGTRSKDDDGNELLPLARVNTLYAADIVDEPATGDELFEFFSESVKPSVEVTKFLNNFLKEPDAMDRVCSFMNRFSVNEEYKNSIINSLEKVANMESEKKETPKIQFTLDEEDGTMLEEEKKKNAELAEKREAEVAELAAQNERDRIFGITGVAEKLGIDTSFANEHVKKGTSLDSFKSLAIDKAAEKSEPVPAVDVVNDGGEKRRKGLEDALMVTSGLEKDQKVISDVRRSQFSGIGLQGLAQTCLREDGVMDIPYTGEALYRKLVEKRYFAQAPAQGSGDFVNVLSNVLNKSLGKGWELANTTFDSWVGTGSLRDFKTADIPRITEIGDVERIREGEAPKQAAMSDTKEQTRLETYGGKYILSRQAMINDDLSVFTDIPSKQARALKIKMNKLCYGLVYDSNGSNSAFEGPTMNEDSAKLFNATAESTAGGHNNLVAAASGTAVTKAALNTGFISLAQHRILTPDDSRSAERYMNIRPRYLVLGPQNFMAAWALLNYPGYNDTNDDSKAEGTVAANVFASGAPRALQLIQEAELDFIDSTYLPWYLVADSNEVDTVKLYTLNGNTNPYTDASATPTGDARGMIWVIEHDFVFKAPDWRGMYCNSGAAK